MAWRCFNYSIVKKWGRRCCSHLTLENFNASHFETFWWYGFYNENSYLNSKKISTLLSILFSIFSSMFYFQVLLLNLEISLKKFCKTGHQCTRALLSPGWVHPSPRSMSTASVPRPRALRTTTQIRPRFHYLHSFFFFLQGTSFSHCFP